MIAIACDFFLLLERNISFLVLLLFKSLLLIENLPPQDKTYTYGQLEIRYKLKTDIILNTKIIFLSVFLAFDHRLIYIIEEQ